MPTTSLPTLEKMSFADLKTLVQTQAQQLKQTREQLLREFQAKLIQACADLGLPSQIAQTAVKGNGHKARVAKMRVRAKGRRKFNPAPIRYRDGAGNAWSGRGHTPQWMRKHERQGHARTEFLVPGA